LQQTAHSTYTYTTSNSAGSVVIGANATTANTSNCIAIGYWASSTGSNSVAIGAGLLDYNLNLLRVGTSVRFNHEGKNYTGEITMIGDGYCYVELDGSDETTDGRMAMVPVWSVVEINALQRFTEATSW
jgi:hypothetical protein